MFRNIKALDRKLMDDCFTLSMKQVSKDYWHLHVSQKSSGNLDALLNEFKRFFELAHKDSRIRFHNMAGISLDPLNSAPPPCSYPKDLPLNTKKGYFGEVLCGIFGFFYQIVEKKKWSIPVFLFRNHDDAADYLFRLSRGEKIGSDIIGRRGNDFLALELSSNNEVKSFLVSEAKCHKNFSTTISKKVHEDLSAEKLVPINVGRMREILMDLKPAGWEEIRNSLGEILFENKISGVNRIDMFTYIFEDPKIKEYPPTRIPSDKKHVEYKNNRSLQAIEVFFPERESFLIALYDKLFT